MAKQGTVVGSQDAQGTGGSERTERPGDVLGTPDPGAVSAAGIEAARAAEAAKQAYVAAAVDRANREELPRLGGAVVDEWAAEG